MSDKYPEIQSLHKGKKMTPITYADWTVNLQGWFCTVKSAGCKNCYMLNTPYRHNLKSKPEWREEGVKEFYKIPAGAVVFLGDMYDVYHEDNPLEWIMRTHELIASRPEITVLLLTKRPEYIAAYWEELYWSDNLWLGATVENKAVIERIAFIKRLPTDNLLLSVEPMLEDITPGLSAEILHGIKWIVCGAESGNNRRPFNKRWAENLKAICEMAGIPFFYKQSSGQYPGIDPYLRGVKHWNFPDGIAPLKYRDPVVPVPVIKQLKMWGD